MRDERTKEMLEAQRIDPKSWGGYLTADKVLEDMYRRLGNYVINTARVFKGKEKPKAYKAVRKQAKKQATASLMTHCLNLSAYAEQEAMDFFREYIAKLKEEEFKNKEQNDKEERECETEMD
jgi:hypothetical protein